MKNIPFLCTALLALSLPLTADAQMISSIDRVRVEVSIITDTDHKELGKTSADRITQKKSFNILLSGKAKNPESRIIKWAAHGRDLKSNNVRTLDSGEIKLELVNGRQTAESKRISTSYTPEHSEVSKVRSRGLTTPRAKRVGATGTKFLGYSVQVLDGGKVVGEASDPVGIGTRK